MKKREMRDQQGKQDRAGISEELERQLRGLLAQDENSMTEKQFRILLTAIVLFGEKGYASTSTKEIADAAGVAEGTIFKHFGSKKELMMYLSERLASQVMRPLASAGLEEIFSADYNSLEDFLYVLMRDRFKLAMKVMPIFKVLLQEIPFQPEVRDILIKNMPLRELEQQMAVLRDKKLVVDLPENALARLFLSCLFGYVFTHFMMLPEQFAGREEKETEYFVQFMTRGMRRECDAENKEHR
ncbi:TetR/AcrR family transcriptional regulator [Bacilliculturomica massiliensis]|uniref:TetR/AcrR family transcriptional regulator n=1 Tax=Bacilliculturomica massiliensis TaxID=1917867 RepID=UPI0010311DDF|nr:TetR/AcrR family transcriptional regulator [Bacilliculturomica massiliensis]